MLPTSSSEITIDVLNQLNVEQSPVDNRDHLNALGGIDGLSKKLGVNLETGLTDSQVLSLREKYGTNEFPESPMTTYWELLIDALSDTTLLILLAAAAVSLIIDIIQEGPEKG